ncbi:MAG: NADH-quinone oxidoreductase subunit F, partial [Parasporobacterium sp.]|nr:NADH-quinone oxidoreductase subunit F [Parasporobacterium sp.]
MRIIVGEGSCGLAAGAGKVYDALKPLSESGSFELGITGCIGMCFLEPIVDVYDGETLAARLVHVTAEDAEAIASAASTGDLSKVEGLKISADDASFLDQQTRIALRNCGIIDPTDIESYKARDGYKALEKVIKEMTPEEVIEVIKTSGLAGRGGAGFPTWFKWNAARASEGQVKYLICNADEGDPGAFMD